MKPCEIHKQVKEIVNGVEDDVEAEKGCVDDNTEEEISERMEKRALVDGGSLQSKHTWKTLKIRKEPIYAIEWETVWRVHVEMMW